MRPELTRAEWWREYARWNLGDRDGPPCGRCGVTIDGERLLPPHSGLCKDCEEGE
jgi:hypothetical protein